MTGDDVMIRMIFLLFLHDNKALDSSSSVCITNYPLQLFIILLLSSNDTRYPANQIIIIICASAGRDSASADAPVVRVLGILSMIRLSLLAAENNRFEVGFLVLCRLFPHLLLAMFAQQLLTICVHVATGVLPHPCHRLDAHLVVVLA